MRGMTSSVAALGVAALSVSVVLGAPAPVQAADPPPVDGTPVGAGSYAPSPPPELGQAVHDTANRDLYLDDSIPEGTPVPTNKWWTDLLVNRYSGDLWADPLVLANAPEGTSVRFPTEWNAEGTAMQLGAPLVVGGVVEPSATSTDLVIADLEDAALPAGWTASGTAFAAPARGTGAGQSAVSGHLGSRLLNSWTDADGDGATGSVVSPAFTIERAHIAALVGGGQQDGRAEVRLVVDDQIVARATGRNSEQLQWVSWDVTAWAGRTAQIEVVDDVTAGWAHVLVDHILQTDDVAGLDARFDTAFVADRADVLGWGEWSVSWRLPQASGAARIDATAARGIPYAWFEFSEVSPRLTIEAGATVTTADGQPLTDEREVDRLVVTQDGRSFGIHVPNGSHLARDGRQIVATTPVPYLAVSALTDPGDLDRMHETAFAVPRDTRMSYDYDPERAVVTQEWTVETEALDGGSLDTLQGWLPHQYKETEHDLELDGPRYASPRGEIRTTRGHTGWTISYPFSGIVPTVPVDGDDDRLAAYVADYATRTDYRADTYWGGKDVLELAEYMTLARDAGEQESYAALKQSLTTALNDWCTYSAGEKEHFFTRYDKWGALIGFGESYGSSQFTDNHFHYGYFTLAAALLAFDDPAWAAQYGPMVSLVARQYAENDRSSTEFPYLRTFDTWSGHSYAGGYSSPGGNNQESSSEAIQSWAGLFLLGTALGDDDMQATGAMGYTTERQAVREYWLNVHGNPDSALFDDDGVFPAAYEHSTTGILFDSGQAFATYFSGDPGWIYGIQWLPTGPWLNYLGWDQEFGRSLLDDMFALRPHEIGQNGVAGGNRAAIQTFVKEWWGIGTYGTIDIGQDRASAIRNLQNAIRAAEKNHPGYATALVAENPLFDAASGTLYVDTACDGSLVFPEQWWTPETLPASLVPALMTDAAVDADPRTWDPPSPLLPYFSTDYVADEATTTRLYAIDFDGEIDVEHAAEVFDEMGEALGNVVLGFVAQNDPELYLELHAQLEETGSELASARSLAGYVYATGSANAALGTPVTDRWTSSPTSQTYRDRETDEYRYVVFNPTDQAATYEVYDADGQIGTVSVPARTQIVTTG